ncbi:Disease resistance protein RPS6 [Cardamine amara subsp. amara]|uniref:ADP-ribosyl cyclase/cyclic ADP-ribose hydrolase n=1 Tax=Cardamine amara subsp. amara TaxID=228776 RepID=A0ABD0ZMC3_CARAN
MTSSSSSSSCNRVYDVFTSFNGEDIRKTFLSHFLKELDHKLITAFKDNEIKRSQSIVSELVQAIKDSRISVVIFSKNYASSSWCLNELLEIVKCKEERDQLVIPVFYSLDPTHVRKQIGEFGKNFEKTCKNKTEEETNQWMRALTDVANISGYHSENWDNEATMIEEIANDIFCKLNSTPSKDFEDFVGIEVHIEKMSLLLCLETEEVRMVGIWGSSGIGKTTIARALFNRIFRHFQSSVFIDRAFVSKSMEDCTRAKADDYNMKLHLQQNFLCEILGKKDIKIDHLGVMGERLKHRKVLIFIDDLDDQLVIDSLVGRAQWFGRGSRIIVVTNDKHLLMAHGIDLIYEVCLPSEELALQMLCQSAFKQNAPPDGFTKLVVEVARHAGNLPLGLNVLGSYLRGRDKEYWMGMLSRIHKGLDWKIEKILRVNYDGLESKEDKAIFRHIACLFNFEQVNDIRLLLADSDLNFNIGLRNLVDKSLIHVRSNILEMHRLLLEMGKEVVRTQSNEPGEREFIMDSKDICDVLEDNTGTKKVLGIALDIDGIDNLYVHEEAFKRMRNLRFLKIYKKSAMVDVKEIEWHLPHAFDYLPPKLRLLSWDTFPLSRMPSKFRSENLVKLRMLDSKLEKLWEGVQPLTCLKDINLRGSKELREIPDLSLTTNLETLNLGYCSSLVELPSSFRYLNKLMKLDMERCIKLETLPSGINLKSLNCLALNGCTRLRSFPDISTNISLLYINRTSIEEIPTNLRVENLVDLHMEEMKSGKLWNGMQLTRLMTMLSLSLATNAKTLYLSDIPNLIELPSFLWKLNKLTELGITNCTNLEILPTGINLESLDVLNFSGCSRLRSFPDISCNISTLLLDQSGIQEVPWWIQKFSRLKFLRMTGCNKLKYVSLNISKLKQLEKVDFSDCQVLTEVKPADPQEASSSLPNNRVPKSELIFMNCFKLNQEAFLQQQSVFKRLILPGEEVPSYFNHRATGNSSLAIPLFCTSLSQQLFTFRACLVLKVKALSTSFYYIDIKVCSRFRDTLGNHIYSADQRHSFLTSKKGSHLIVFDCCLSLNMDIQFRLTDARFKFTIKGCGLRLCKQSTPSETTRSSNLNIVGAANKSNSENETKQRGGSEETERSSQRIKVTKHWSSTEHSNLL